MKMKIIKAKLAFVLGSMLQLIAMPASYATQKPPSSSYTFEPAASSITCGLVPLCQLTIRRVLKHGQTQQTRRALYRSIAFFIKRFFWRHNFSHNMEF